MLEALGSWKATIRQCPPSLCLWLGVGLFLLGEVPCFPCWHCTAFHLTHRCPSQGTSQKDYYNKSAFIIFFSFSFSFIIVSCYFFFHVSLLRVCWSCLPSCLFFISFLLLFHQSFCFLPPGLIFNFSFFYSLLPRKGTTDSGPSTTVESY